MQSFLAFIQFVSYFSEKFTVALCDAGFSKDHFFRNTLTVSNNKKQKKLDLKLRENPQFVESILNLFSILFQYENCFYRYIQNPVKHKRWSVLRK